MSESLKTNPLIFYAREKKYELLFLIFPFLYLAWQFLWGQKYFKASPIFEMAVIVYAILWAFVLEKDRLTLKHSGSYSLLAVNHFKEILPYDGWRILLTLSFIPGLFYLLFFRIRELWWKNGAGLTSGYDPVCVFIIISAAFIVLFQALFYKNYVWTEEKGIQQGLVFWMPWKSMERVETDGKCFFVYKKGRVNIPQMAFVIPDQRTIFEFTTLLKSKEIELRNPPKKQTVPKMISVVFLLLLTIIAVYLENYRAGLWYWKVVILMTSALAVKFFEERYTGMTRLSRNQIRPQ